MASSRAVKFDCYLINQSHRIYIVIVIVNSRFLQRPQKRSRGSQLVHRRLTRTKSICRGFKIQIGRQTIRRNWDGYGGWCL